MTREMHLTSADVTTVNPNPNLIQTPVKSMTTVDVIIANPSSNPIPNPSQICDDGGCDYD